MGRIHRPTSKVTVWDPDSQEYREAATTDPQEMNRRAKKAIADAKVQLKQATKEQTTETISIKKTKRTK